MTIPSGDSNIPAHQDLFHELAESIPQLVWLADPDGQVVWLNRRWLEYTGKTAGELKGSAWQSVLDPASLPQVLGRHRNSLAAGNPFQLTFSLRAKDGAYHTFQSRVVPVRDSQGNPSRWFAINTDIEEKVQNQAQLQQSQERLRAALSGSQRLAAIVQSSEDAIVSKDLTGIVTSWNRGAERIFGYTAEQMIGKSINRIIPSEYHEEEKTFLAMIAQGERLDHYQTTRLTESGEFVEVSLTLSPVRDDIGNIVGVAKIARDITQQKKAERALHTSDRLATVGRLAATIAHEINNPLAAVTNLIFLARLGAESAEVQDLLDRAEEELARVAQLTKQTLGFFRSTRGAEPQSLAKLVNELVPIYSSRTKNKAIHIEVEVRQDPTVYCVPGEIRQIVANLLNNSLDAVNPGDKIKVRIATARARNGSMGPGVRLTIADSGTGVPPAVRKRLFEPFFTTKKDFGTGLGLWVCKNIVEKHGARMQMRSSVTPGKSGTVFSMFFPLHAAQEKPSEDRGVSNQAPSS